MSDEQGKPRSEADAALQKEILLGREFNLADAIGRMAGPGIRKGSSSLVYSELTGLMNKEPQMRRPNSN